jgi:sialate O-acetylesterase
VHLFRNSEQWALATHPLNESTGTRHPVNSETANSGHGPYIRFAKQLQAALGYPIGLVQTSLGGSPLQRWNPTEPGTPDLYENMLHCVQLTGGRVKGILWYQGESDTPTATASTYLKRFGKAVAAWRKALKIRS